MTNNKKVFNLIIILFILLAAITIGIIFSAYDNAQFTTFSKDTAVGNVYVGGMFPNDAINTLDKKVSKWKEDATINLVYQGYEIEISKSKFSFFTTRSIDRIKNGSRNNKLEVAINDEIYLENVLSENETLLKFNDFNMDLLEQAVLYKVSTLYETVKIDIEPYVNEDYSKANLLNEVSINYTNASFLSNRFNYYIKEIKVQGNEQFNLIDSLDDQILLTRQEVAQEDEFDFTDEEISVVATGIYNLILDTNFVNIKKYISKECPQYADPGYEVLASKAYNLDFTFYNPNGNSYFIKLKYDDQNDQLVFQLYGVPFIDTYSHDNEETILQPTDLYWYFDTWNNEEVEEGQSIKVETGSLGYRNLVYRMITKQSGLEEKVLLTEDVYMPTPNIYVRKTTK